MKLGIFGGTFNPIHNGHLINVEIIRSDFKLDKIVLVPAKVPVHKTLTGDVPAEERYAMTLLAVAGLRDYEVSRIEIDRKEPSYTITTVHEMKKLYPDSDFHLIIGMDSLNELCLWREPDHLLEHVTLIVMRRPGEKCDPQLDLGKYDVRFADNPLIDVSSTMIRERLRAGKSIRFLVPDSVIDYIEKKGLYGR